MYICAQLGLIPVLSAIHTYTWPEFVSLINFFLTTPRTPPHLNYSLSWYFFLIGPKVFKGNKDDVNILVQLSCVVFLSLTILIFCWGVFKPI